MAAVKRYWLLPEVSALRQSVLATSSRRGLQSHWQRWCAHDERRRWGRYDPTELRLDRPVMGVPWPVRSTRGIDVRVLEVPSETAQHCRVGFGWRARPTEDERSSFAAMAPLEAAGKHLGRLEFLVDDAVPAPREESREDSHSPSEV
jgi:hypothetical protein